MSILLVDTISNKNQTYFVGQNSNGIYNIVSSINHAKRFKNKDKAINVLKNLPKVLKHRIWIPMDEQDYYQKFTFIHMDDISDNTENIELHNIESYNDDYSIQKYDITDFNNSLDIIKNLLCQYSQTYSQKLSEYNCLLKMLSEKDKELTDISHYIEFNKFSASKGYKISSLQQKKLKERRMIKDMIETYRFFFTAIKPINIENSINHIDNIENKKYAPRTEVFNELKNL